MRERKLDWVFKGKLDDACDDFMKYIESQRRIVRYAVTAMFSARIAMWD